MRVIHLPADEVTGLINLDSCLMEICEIDLVHFSIVYTTDVYFVT